MSAQISTIWRALYAYQGKYAEAEPLYQRALAIREQALGPTHPDVAKSLNNLSAALSNAKRKYAEAKPLYQRALTIFEEVWDQNIPPRRTVRKNYEDLLKKMESEKG